MSFGQVDDLMCSFMLTCHTYQTIANRQRYIFPTNKSNIATRVEKKKKKYYDTRYDISYDNMTV